LERADLTEADLTGANLYAASLAEVALDGAIFERAILDEEGYRLANAKGGRTTGAVLAATADEAAKRYAVLVRTVGLPNHHEESTEVFRDDGDHFRPHQRKGNSRRAASIPSQLSELSSLLADHLLCQPHWRVRPPLAKKRCFVLMPFNESLRGVYTDHIKPTIERVGLECIRGDSIFDNKPIMEDVWKGIFSSRVVIADLTGRNPNVFYELGICHTLGKEVILMTQKPEDVPFDIQHLRYIVYAYTPPGMRKFEAELEATVRTLLKRTSGAAEEALFRRIDVELYNLASALRESRL
jgi:hypothetical protein